MNHWQVVKNYQTSNQVMTRRVEGMHKGYFVVGGGRKLGKFLNPFSDIFGKFVNKYAIKSDFGGGLGRYILKISKKYPFWGENTSTNGQKF